MQNKLKIELYVIEHIFVMRYNKYAEGVKSEIGDIVFLGLFLSMQVDTGKQINTKNQVCLTSLMRGPVQGRFHQTFFMPFSE